MMYERDRRTDELQELTKDLEVQSTLLAKAQPVNRILLKLKP